MQPRGPGARCTRPGSCGHGSRRWAVPRPALGGREGGGLPLRRDRGDSAAGRKMRTRHAGISAPIEVDGHGGGKRLKRCEGIAGRLQQRRVVPVGGGRDRAERNALRLDAGRGVGAFQFSSQVRRQARFEALAQRPGRDGPVMATLHPPLQHRAQVNVPHVVVQAPFGRQQFVTQQAFSHVRHAAQEVVDERVIGCLVGPNRDIGAPGRHGPPVSACGPMGSQ